MLVHRFLLELGEEETAAALGVRRGTVKSRTSRALDRLRELVGEVEAMTPLERELTRPRPGRRLARGARRRVAHRRAGRGAPCTAPQASAGAGRRARRGRRRACDARRPAGPHGRLRLARASGAPGSRSSTSCPRSRRLRGSRSSATSSRSRMPRLERASRYAAPPDGEPAPDEMRVTPGLRVAYLWRDGERVRLLVTQFPGRSADEPGLVKKLLGSGTSVEQLEVDGDPAVWIEGGPHVVLLAAPDGTIREENGWLAGNTLLVDRDGVTIRVEGDLTRDQSRAPSSARCAADAPSDEGSRLARGGYLGRGSKSLERVMTPAPTPDYKAYGGGETRAAPVRWSRAGAPAYWRPFTEA